MWEKDKDFAREVLHRPYLEVICWDPYTALVFYHKAKAYAADGNGLVHVVGKILFWIPDNGVKISRQRALEILQPTEKYKVIKINYHNLPPPDPWITTSK